MPSISSIALHVLHFLNLFFFLMFHMLFLMLMLHMLDLNLSQCIESDLHCCYYFKQKLSAQKNNKKSDENSGTVACVSEDGDSLPTKHKVILLSIAWHFVCLTILVRHLPICNLQWLKISFAGFNI